MSDLIQLTREEHVAVLTINNPPANIWTKESLHLLQDIIDVLNADDTNTALVITGQGEKFFSAGADLKVFSSGDKGQAWEMADAFGQAFETLSWYQGVSIAAINGYAMGGGLEVALACDIRIAEEHAVMALPEGKVGLLPCAGGTQNLAWLVGEGWAKRMILCGDQVDASKAEKIGLVEEVVAKGASFEKAMELANNVAKQNPTAVRITKQLIQAARETSIVDALVSEREEFIRLFDDPNALEGVTAFVEKREPKWEM